MNIQGFQKLTLLDFPGHTACTVFTGGCNMRCPFCHNSPLVLAPTENEPFTEEEILSYLKKRSGILDGVAVTGGEPLLQGDIADFLEKVKAQGFLVKLDTNGSFPEKLNELIEKKLVDYIAMDIKNRPEKYALTVGVKNFDIAPVEKSIEIIKNGGVDYEFRTTAVKEFHTVEDIAAAAEWISGAKRYFIQSFRDSGAILSEGCSAPEEEEIRRMVSAASPFVGTAEARGI